MYTCTIKIVYLLTSASDSDSESNELKMSNIRCLERLYDRHFRTIGNYVEKNGQPIANLST